MAEKVAKSDLSAPSLPADPRLSPMLDEGRAVPENRLEALLLDAHASVVGNRNRMTREMKPGMGVLATSAWKDAIDKMDKWLDEVEELFDGYPNFRKGIRRYDVYAGVEGAREPITVDEQGLNSKEGEKKDG